jgi:hypothetical protein
MDPARGTVKGHSPPLTNPMTLDERITAWIIEADGDQPTVLARLRAWVTASREADPQGFLATVAIELKASTPLLRALASEAWVEAEGDFAQVDPRLREILDERENPDLVAAVERQWRRAIIEALVRRTLRLLADYRAGK